jgi:CBS domain-containing protein
MRGITTRIARESTTDDANEVEGLVGWMRTGTDSDPTEFDRELDDDPRCQRGLQDERGAFRARLASGTGQFDLRAAEPHRDLDSPLAEAASEPVSRIMTRKVTCVRGDMSAAEARARMLSRGVSGLPVVDNWGRAIGVVSKTDLVEHEVTASSQKTVNEIMMPMVFALGQEMSIGQAAALMAYEGIHRVIVVDDGGYLVGVVSSLDLARWLGWHSGHPVGRTL